jgi:superfamily II DNA or RNA helicase
VTTFSAALLDQEAVLRFPYDEELRQLLRAIPGRRWDPIQRAWCIPLGPEQARALEGLLGELDCEPEISDDLARALRRRRAARDRREFPVDLARPDQDWWLSFPTDLAPGPAERLLEHPLARELPPIARGLVPVDELAAEILGELHQAGCGLLLGPGASRAVAALRAGPGAPAGEGSQDAWQPGAAEGGFDVEFRRDRQGEHWILIGPLRAPLARVLAGRLGLRALEARGGAVGLAARERDAEALAELIGRLEDARIDPRVESWLERARTWRGTIEVSGPPEEPVFLLLGEAERLPSALKASATRVPGGATVPLSASSWDLMDGKLEAWMTPAARRCVSALAEGRPAPAAVLQRSEVHPEATFVLAPGHDPSLLEEFGALAGAVAPSARRGRVREHSVLPAIRADPFCVPELDGFLGGREVWVESEALGLLQEIREEHARAAGLVALSAASDASLEVPGLGGELKPFQRAGVRYLLERRRAFLADEQGLGKTIEALATIEAAEAYPAVVVCPASLKLNWLRELSLWLPGRTARALAGHGRRDRPGHADITVVNYDILDARLTELSGLEPRAVVFDESHYCKNAAAKRTRAAQRLAATVPEDGLVLALTGTPVTNRPAELISQLRILGRLQEFGSGVHFGERFRGPDAHLRLHWHLRARCFVRRLKADVLPQLPAKTRAVVPIELDNEAEYRLAERDVVAWLQSQPMDLRELDAKVAAALRAERLVRLNALKLLAARGKLASALRWIHDFSSSGERLVLFARHREIQRAVLEHFPHALHILGADTPRARQEALDAFQGPDGPENQLIVCSIEVAGQGLTLTRSSNVAFLELDWTPAKHDQAEDRCHRIGQQDAVNAYYLLAAETVDESIATLLERKRAVIGAVTDGREEDVEPVVDALIRELRGAPYRHLRAVA